MDIHPLYLLSDKFKYLYNYQQLFSQLTTLHIIYNYVDGSKIVTQTKIRECLMFITDYCTKVKSLSINNTLLSEIEENAVSLFYTKLSQFTQLSSFHLQCIRYFDINSNIFQLTNLKQLILDLPFDSVYDYPQTYIEEQLKNVINNIVVNMKLLTSLKFNNNVKLWTTSNISILFQLQGIKHLAISMDKELICLLIKNLFNLESLIVTTSVFFKYSTNIIDFIDKSLHDEIQQAAYTTKLRYLQVNKGSMYLK